MRNWLVVLREQNNLTQIQVAETAEVTRQTISAIENGSANPSVETAKSIAKILGFPWTDFFEENKTWALDKPSIYTFALKEENYYV